MIEPLWRGLPGISGGGAGSVEEAPRYATLWLQAREIQMGTLRTGRKEVRRFGNVMATLVTFTECLFLLGQ